MQIKKVGFRSSDVKNIYFESFPKTERMPFSMMVAMSKLWNTDFLSFFDDDKLCGFVYLAHNRKIVFVMFLAVDKTLRSKGYGSAILQEIQNRYPNKKIIISIEPCDNNAPDIDLRTRRKGFYMRNGYKETGHSDLQRLGHCGGRRSVHDHRGAGQGCGNLRRARRIYIRHLKRTFGFHR